MTRAEVVSLGLLSLVIAISSDAVAASKYVAKNPQAVAVAKAAFDAMGGVQAVAGYQDSVSSGMVTIYAAADPVSYPITMKSKGLQETRVELQEPKGTNVRIVNQGQGVILKPDGTIKNLILDNTIAERVAHVPLLSLLAEYQDTDTNVTYQGTADVEGQPADVVAVSFIPATATDASQAQEFVTRTQTLFFVDQKSGLVSKMQYTNYAENDPGSQQKVEVFFAKYQSVIDMSVPFQITTYVDGQLESQIVLDSFAFNVGLSDTEFALPK